ncbi:MAG: hypothetical protein L3J52_02400 [Proteobacteria bacterium]|nr:hypothetical protein [Pseudomonadota bacterium]
MAALLIVAVTNADGIISLEEKMLILKIFEGDLQQSQQEASGLLTSSVFFLKEEDNVAKNMAKILKFTAKKITPHQVEFTVECMQKIVSLSTDQRESQLEIINQFERFFRNKSQ